MDIVIVSQYLRNIECFENNNSRFVYLAKLLKKSKKNNIEIITSNFNHAKKEKFNKVGELAGIKVTACQEPGYPKNICLKRFNSHKKLSRNIEKYLEKRKKPDIIYVAVPSLKVAKVCANYCKKNKVKFVVDIQDLWPEAFKMVFHVPVISNIIFYPLEKQANYIYKNANDIIAVSDTYADRASRVNKIYKQKLSVYLGTDLEFFDNCNKQNEVFYNDDVIRLAYIGTLGHSYDLKCTIDALKILKEQGINNIKFIIMGNGPLMEEFENYAKEKNVDCEFTGRLDYDKMVGRLCACDIAINPISKGAAQSIINKVGDYAAASLPVINTQECEEYRKLVENYQIGFNCENNNAEDLAEKIKKLYEDKILRERLGRNNRKLAEEKFDRKVTYKEIIKLVEEE